MLSKDKNSIKRENLKQGGILVLLAMLAFSGLGLEALLAFLIEPLIYGTDMSGWTATQNITHWMITCVVWLVIAAGLVFYSRKKIKFQFYIKGDWVPVGRWIMAIVLIGFLGLISYWDWDGIKIVKEFQYHGPVLFTFQYFYYLVETVLVVLMIAFAQEAGEKYFESNYIPYGGGFLALTWGMVHGLTKGNLLIGIISAVFAIIFGRIYILMGKDMRKAFPLIFIALVI